MKKRIDYKLLFLLLLVLSLCIFIFVVFIRDKSSLVNSLVHTNNNPISINYSSGLYEEALNIKINYNKTLPFDTKIYYTLNGDDPTKDSNLYEDNIYLELNDDIKLYPLKIILYSNDNYSDIYNYTYIIGKNIKSDIDLEIASLTTNNDNLYNEKTGLFVEDVLRKGNELTKKGNLSIYNNYQELANQGVGIRLSGHASVKYDVKSFKLMFGNGFDKEKDKLELDLYSRDVSKHSISSSYNSLIFRGGSQDTDFSNIKSSLMNNLLDSNSLVSGSRRMLFFLNGEFQGVYDVINSMNEDTIANMYDINDKNNISIYEGSETDVFKNSNLSYLFENDLSDNKNQKLLESKIDIDSYFKYYAAAIITNNRDIFLRNFKAFRYSGDTSSILNSDTLYVLPFDFDDCYHYDRRLAGIDDVREVIDLISDMDTYAVYFKKLIKQDCYKNKFMNILVNLLDTSFREDNIINNINNEFNKIDKSYSLFYDSKSRNNIISNIDYMKDEVKSRNTFIINRMKKILNITNSYTLNIKSGEGVLIKIGDTLIEENNSYSIKYYGNNNLITFSSYMGYDLDHITINDYDLPLLSSAKEFEVTNNYLDYYKNNLTIEIYAKKNNETLIIEEISASGDSDWFKLTNVSSNEINISDYYLSDNYTNLNKYKLPDKVLKSGESVIINGSKNYYSIGDYISNFNLNSKETLYLYNPSTLKVIDEMPVPKMGDDESYGRLNKTNEYRFFNNKNNIRKK